MKTFLICLSLFCFFTLPVFSADQAGMGDLWGSCVVNGNNVVLNWGDRLQNFMPDPAVVAAGEDEPDFMRIIIVERNGEIIAKLNPFEQGYVDRNVPEGEYHYVVSAQFDPDIFPGIEAPVILLLDCKVVVNNYNGPRNLQCQVICPIPVPIPGPVPIPLPPVLDGEDPAGNLNVVVKGEGDGEDGEIVFRFCSVLLTWENPIHYIGILIVKDGHSLTLLPGTDESWTDERVTSGRHNYQVYGIIPGILPVEAEAAINKFNEEPSEEVRAEALTIVGHYLFRLSKPAECSVKVPETGPQGPYDLKCIVIDIDSWDMVPEFADLSPEILPSLPFKGVLLVWKNPKFYETITIKRDGERIASIPGTDWYFLDPKAAPGKHVYTVSAFDMGMPTRPASCTVNVPGEIPPQPADLSCRVMCIINGQELDLDDMPDMASPGIPVACNVVMRWRNPANYDWIIVTLDGDQLFRVPGNTNHYVDRDPPQGPHTYGVIGVRNEKSSEETICKVYVPPPPPIRPPRNLSCTISCDDISTTGDCNNVLLTWENGQDYEWIVIMRNGEPLARVPGNTTDYTDKDLEDGVYTYAVSGMVGDQLSASALCRVAIPEPPLKPPYDLVCITNIGPEPIDIPDDITLPGAEFQGGENGDVRVIPLNAVFLRWRNGSEYDVILIYRDKVLVDKLPGESNRYIDTDVDPGKHVYFVIGVAGDERTEAATCTVEVTGPVPPPENLTCELLPIETDPTTEDGLLGPAVKLAWENPVEYNTIMIFRNRCLIAKLEGDSTSYVDRGLLPGGYIYSVVGLKNNSGSIPVVCEIKVPGPVPPPQRLTCEPLPVDCDNSADCITSVIKLAWYNPVKYGRIVILRDGEEITQLPGDSERYYDKDVEPGSTYTYGVIGILNSGEESEAAKCEITLPPEPLKPPHDLECMAQEQTVFLKWINGEAYSSIIIARDNAELISIPGSSESYTDEGVAPGKHLYMVAGIGEDGTQSAAARCAVEVEGTVLRNILHFGRMITADNMAPTGSATCFADNKDPLEAWSFGVCNDPNLFVPTDATTEGTFAADLNGGDGPGFLSINITDAGVTMAAIVQNFPPAADTLGDPTIEPGKNRSLLSISYELVRNNLVRMDLFEAGGSYLINYCSKLGDPPVSTLFVVNGFEVKPVTLPGYVRFEPPALVKFIRGDANADGALDIGDVITILGYLFNGGEVPPCLQAADANESNLINIADAVYLLNFLFSEGAPPPAPYPECGLPADNVKRVLSCDSFPPCE